MSFISNIYKKTTRIFYTGVTPDMPFSGVQKTVMFNIALIIGLPFIIAGIPINFSNGRHDLALFNCALLALYIIGLYFNAIQKKLWIRTLIFILSSWMFVFGLLYFRNGTEYILLITLMSAVILLDNKLLFVLFSLTIIGFVTYIRVRDINMLGFTSYAEANPYVNIFYSQFLYVLFLYSFKYLYDKYQNQLTIAYKQLKASKESKDKVMRIVAHDLRSPIGGISSLSKILMDEENASPQVQKEYLSMIHLTASQSLALIGQLLQNETEVFSDLQTSEVSLVQLARRVTQLLKPAADEKKQILELRAPAADLVVSCDADKITRVVQNLVSNAIKFTRHGGHIIVSVFRENGEHHISVSDNGIGIPSELLGRVFEQFSNARRKGTAGETSFGLGLSVCKQIAEAHSGNITVTSEPNLGTRFTLSLP